MPEDIRISNFPNPVNVAGSITAVPVYSTVPAGVSGTVNIGGPGTLDVFGQVVTVNRIPLVQAQFFQVAPSGTLTMTTSGGATSAQGVGTGIFSTGTGASSEVMGVTFNTISYTGHEEVYAAQTAAFTTPTNSSSYERIGIYNSTDGFSWGFNGTTFGLWTRFNSVDTFLSQSQWNTDTCTGQAGTKFTNVGVPQALNPANMNLYRIRFGWLGIAPVIFEVLAPDGQFVIAHQTRPANNQATPTLSNPNLPMTLDVKKTASDATNLQITCGCWVAGSTGPAAPTLQALGTIGANNQAVTLRTIGLTTVAVQLSGSWSGNIIFEGTIDGYTWFADSIVTDTGVIASSASAPGQFFADVAAYNSWRVRGNGAITGACIATLVGSVNATMITLAAPLPNGGNTIGSVLCPVAQTNAPSYFGALTLTGSVQGSAIDASTAALVDLSFIVNAMAGNFTGSIAAQGSNDGTNWLDQQVTAVSVGPGALAASGSYQAPAWMKNYRLAVNFTAGSGAQLTGSSNLKG
jgi:hypothetical protein